MKKVLIGFLVLAALYVHAQAPKEIPATVSQKEIKEHLTYLASDELAGRDTGSPGIEKAATYIEDFFKKQGLKPANGKSYFQPVNLTLFTPPAAITLMMSKDTFKVVEDLIVYSGQDIDFKGEIVFVSYGSDKDLDSVSVKDKIVVAFVGSKEDGNLINALLSESPAKAKRIKAKGAKALIEIVITPGVPFFALSNYFHKDRMMLEEKEGGNFTHLWMKNSDLEVIANLKKEKSTTGSLKVSGIKTKPIPAKNIAGILEGTDKKMKEEYLIVSAHYDHVGIGQKDAEQDSIYNGARDNALGTVGMMMTAKYLGKHKPKRSVLFLAFTAEEKGLLGSTWYAEHPLVPLNKTVFNFNCDGAGYNDTTSATIIGLERTSAEAILNKACEAYGLKATLDPVPEQNLYERSDNYNFARVGIPAVDFSTGLVSFDEEIMKYYHQPADEVETLNFSYLTRFYHAFVYANEILANSDKVPFWKEGDKFEAAGKKLYGK